MFGVHRLSVLVQVQAERACDTGRLFRGAGGVDGIGPAAVVLLLLLRDGDLQLLVVDVERAHGLLLVAVGQTAELRLEALVVVLELVLDDLLGLVELVETERVQVVADVLVLVQVEFAHGLLELLLALDLHPVVDRHRLLVQLELLFLFVLLHHFRLVFFRPGEQLRDSFEETCVH